MAGGAQAQKRILMQNQQYNAHKSRDLAATKQIWTILWRYVAECESACTRPYTGKHGSRDTQLQASFKIQENVNTAGWQIVTQLSSNMLGSGLPHDFRMLKQSCTMTNDTYEVACGVFADHVWKGMCISCCPEYTLECH